MRSLTHAPTILRLTTIPNTGIHLFMALYGLSVFLETPKPLRTGRKRYIWTSFAITVLFGVCTSLDAANYFQELFVSTSASHFLEIRINNLHNWNHLAVGAQFGILVLLGEALLVSETSLIPRSFTQGSYDTGLPMLCHLR